MKTAKLVNFLILILYCLAVYPQNILQSFNLRMNRSTEERIDKTNVSKLLRTEFNIPGSYEFKRQVIKGTKDKTSEKDALGYVHERYCQYYKGIKIEHSDIRVRYLGGVLSSANGGYINVPDIDTAIHLSKDEAVQKAKEYIGAEEYMWENEAENNWLKSITNGEKTSFYPNPEIVICKNSMDADDMILHTAYKMDIYAKKPFRHECVYVDAKSGAVLNVRSLLCSVDGTAATRYSGKRTISTQPYSGRYRLRDYSRGRGIETYNLKRSTSISDAVDFFDGDNNWTAFQYHNADKDDAALDAHWAAMMTYDYFKNVHGRNSYDNNNSVVRAYVHYGNQYDSAQWHSGYDVMFFGDGRFYDAFTSLDIVAHEFGHGVNRYSAELPNEYSEPGAIMESLSDIWGACVENWAAPEKQTWLIGEDIEAHLDPALRSMSDPGLYWQPDTYGCGEFWFGSDDDPHVNSGIMNHWFYVLCEGKTGINGLGDAYDVEGIGIKKAEKIVYRAETTIMTSDTNFALAREQTIQAAIELFGGCSPEVMSVANAWYAVGLYEPLTGPGITTISDTTFASDTAVDNCNIILNNVKLDNQTKLTIDAQEVIIYGLFEAGEGAELEIK